MTRSKMRISSLLFVCVHTSVLARAESASPHFDQTTLSDLKACFGGQLSQSDEKKPVRQKIERGNLAFLDQRKPSLSCPNPDTNTLAWVEPSEGNSAADLHIMRLNDEKEFVSERYRVDMTTLKDSAYVVIPNSEHSCASAYETYLEAENPLTSKPKLTVKISSWDIERHPCDPRPIDLKRRFSFEHVASLPTGTTALKSDDFRKVEAPSESQMLEEIFRHMTRTFERADDFLLDLSRAERKNLLESCLKAQQSLEKMIPPGGSPASKAAAHSRQALLEASSIFVSPIEGHTTIGKFQEQNDARLALLKKPPESCHQGGSPAPSQVTPSPAGAR